jgi:conjugative relaxase-like TrwC/TraI family protein
MLSVGVVTGNGLGYYLDAVGSGIDDYYVRAEPGRWTGAGAAALRLIGEVEAGQIATVAARVDPVSGEPLGGRPGKVVSFDLTFSAPKTVSALVALGSPDVRQAVEQPTTLRWPRPSS